MNIKYLSLILVMLLLSLGGTYYYMEIGHKDKTEKRDEDMILIAEGAVIIGRDAKSAMKRPNEIPAHKVELKGFFIDKYEVTNAQYREFIRATDYKALLVDPVNKNGSYNWKDAEYPNGEDENPVVLADWKDAMAYCRWAGKRLPAENEWEKACRGTEDSREWSYGDEFTKSKANTRELNLMWSRPASISEGDISSYGVVNMTGNVMEWTNSWYLPYPGSTYKDSKFGRKYKVVRGGSWLNNLATGRCSNRMSVPVEKRHRAIGLRCAKDLPLEVNKG